MPASAVAELDAALAHVKKKGLDWSQITRADFPISGLDGLLADIADELENGVGIMKLRGFPVERYQGRRPAPASTSAWARISARRCSRTAAAS